MDSVEAEITEFSSTIEMLVGKGKNCALCFGFDHHILIIFSKKTDSFKREGQVFGQVFRR